MSPVEKYKVYLQVVETWIDTGDCNKNTPVQPIEAIAELSELTGYMSDTAINSAGFTGILNASEEDVIAWSLWLNENQSKLRWHEPGRTFYLMD